MGLPNGEGTVPQDMRIVASEGIPALHLAERPCSNGSVIRPATRKEESMSARSGNRYRVPIAIGALTVSMVLAAVGIAMATPPGGTSTAVTLADGNTANSVNINIDPTKLRTKDSVEVFQVSQTAAPGFTSGWHMHTGPVIVNVTAGSLTFYEANCTTTTVTAPGAYIEMTAQPILARNEGSVGAAWVTSPWGFFSFFALSVSAFRG
jgi:quercetin dioxygenase-like cupin family protein